MSRMALTAESIRMPSVRIDQLVLALVFVGYPLAAVLTALPHMPGPEITRAFRVGFVLLSAWMVATRWKQILAPRIVGWQEISILLFLFVYGTSLFFDIGTPGLLADGKPFFLFIVTLLPPLALFLVGLSGDNSTYCRLIKYAGVGICVGLLLLELGAIPGATTTAIQDRLSLERLNPISVGMLSATVIICAVADIRVTLSGLSVLALCLIPPSLCTILAASKGPIAALFVGLEALMFLRFGLSRKFVWSSLIVVIGVAGLFLLSSEANVRMLHVAEDKSTSERIALYKTAVQGIAISPLTGGGARAAYGSAYTHNIVLEAAVYRGIFFSIWLLVILFPTVRTIISRKCPERLHALGALFASYLCTAVLSGALFAISEVWVCVFLLGQAGRSSNQGIRLPGIRNLHKWLL